MSNVDPSLDEALNPNPEVPGTDNDRKEDFSDEDMRLGTKSPVRTVLALSVGPLISQTVQAFYGIADSLWVAKTIGQIGISVFGAVFIVEFVAIAVSNYLMSSLGIQLAYLFGEGKTEHCAQMYVDFIRLAFILGILVPAVVMPTTVPLVKWFGADDELANLCFQYMLPVTCLCFLNFLYMMGCGLIQAEGRSLMYGLVQVGSFAMNMGIFDPLFLVGFKTPIWGASLATIIAEGIPGVTLTILILCGKFSLHFKPRMFISKPTIETWKGLKVGFASLISQVSYTIPLILMQKYVNLASSSISHECYSTVLAVWSVVEKLYQLVGGVCVAFSYGMLPSSSYAFGAGRLNRVMWLFIHATWIATAVSLVMSVFMIAIPEKLAQIWSKDPYFLEWVKAMVPKVFYTTIFIAYQYTAPAILQAMQRVLASTLLSVLTLLLPLPVFSSILYFTDKTNPARIMWTYALNDTFSAVACTFFLIAPGRLVWKAPKDESLTIKCGHVIDTEAESEGQETTVAC